MSFWYSADREATAQRREAHRVVVAAGRAKRSEEEAGRDREAARGRMAAPDQVEADRLRKAAARANMSGPPQELEKSGR